MTYPITEEPYLGRLGQTAHEAMQQSTGGCWADGQPWRTDVLRDSEMVDVAAAVAARVLADARVFLRERLWAIAAGELAEWAEAHGIDLENAR